MKFFIGFAMFLIPWVVSAAIVINEIAWMGSLPRTGESSTTASNNEWIELYNPDSEMSDLEGLTFAAVDGQPSIALVGTIPAGGYFLLERADDETVPGIVADLIYTGALSNSGEKLELKNTAGAIVDSVDAMNGWPAGDNITKETMQRLNAGGWITASGTPRAANATTMNHESGIMNQGETQMNSASSSIIHDSNSVIYEQKRFFTVDAGKDIKTVAGAEVRFSGAAFNGDGKPLGETSGMARYLWNFGDGAFFEGKNVNHIYRYPGIYRAVLYVSSGETSGSDVLEAMVGKSNVAISEIAGAWVELTNGGATAVDVSSWQIRSDALTYIIPARTTIGPGAFVVFSQEITNLLFGPVNPKAELRYANGTFADMLSFVGMLPPEKSVIRDEEGKGAIGEQTPGRENMNHESGIMNQGKKEKSTIPPIIYNPSFMIQPEESSKIELPQKKEVLQASLFSSNYFWLAVSVSIGLIVGAVVLVLRSMILF